MFKKIKQVKKLIFDPKIALRVELSDPAQNSFFPADFLSARLECSQFLQNCAKIKVVYRRARGERWPEKNTDDQSELQHDSQPWQNRI